MGISKNFPSDNIRKKIYIHLDCETRGPKAGRDQLIQLSLLAAFAEYDICPDSDNPFQRGLCPCFVDQKTWSFHSDEIRWDENTKSFWNQHHRVYREITENCLPTFEVVQQISAFLTELDSKYIIKGIVMSPSWFDWSHFVHCYNIFSETFINRFDPGKLNVICLKSYVNFANHLGIPVFYHPNLKHTHNSEKDVQVAAYKFYWLERAISITRNDLLKYSQRIKEDISLPDRKQARTFHSYAELLKHRLKNEGDESIRWKTPKTHNRFPYKKQQGIFTMNDYIRFQSSKTFTWQQQRFINKKR
jgi:hypothetical protein